jgi:hypothetical protein
MASSSGATAIRGGSVVLDADVTLKALFLAPPLSMNFLNERAIKPWPKLT